MAFNQQTGFKLSGRVLFIILLVVGIVLCAAYAREGDEGPLHRVQGAASEVAMPLRYASAAVGNATDSASDALGDLAADADTLNALRDQNAQLRRLVVEAEEYRQEADRLKKLLSMKSTSGVEGVTAQIIGRSAEAWNQSVTLNVGTADGVSSGMSVLGTSGVVGQVSRATPHTCTVRLLADPNSGAAVMIQSSRAGGIVRGSLEGILYLEDIDEDKIPEVGDVVITSGLGGSYVRGLIVGTVANVTRTKGNASGNIVVSTNDDVSTLEEVIVVTGMGERSDDDDADADAAVGADSGAASGEAYASASSAQ